MKALPFYPPVFVDNKLLSLAAASVVAACIALVIYLKYLIYINREMMTIVSTLLETLATLDVTKMMDARCIGQVARTSQ